MQTLGFIGHDFREQKDPTPRRATLATTLQKLAGLGMPFLRQCLVLLLCLRGFGSETGALVWEGDICVMGGTSGGVAAAVQAARMGRSVALVEPGNLKLPGPMTDHW